MSGYYWFGFGLKSYTLQDIVDFGGNILIDAEGNVISYEKTNDGYFCRVFKPGNAVGYYYLVFEGNLKELEICIGADEFLSYYSNYKICENGVIEAQRDGKIYRFKFKKDKMYLLI